MLLFAPLASFGSEPSKKQAKAEAFAVAADEALRQGQLDDAWTLAGKAIGKDPDHVRAYFIRGAVTLRLASLLTDPAEQTRLIQAAAADFQAVSRLDPAGVLGGIARGILQGATARAPLPIPPVACPPESEQALAAAEQAFAKHDLAAARESYGVAIAGCPHNPTWHVYLGDAWFTDGDSVAASRHYEHALTLDPCNWQAHRFLGDVAVGARQNAQAHAHLTEALACNPAYHAARGQLADVVGTGSHAPRWPDPPAHSAHRSSGEPWKTLAFHRQIAADAGATPMEAERAAVRATLVAWRANPGTDETFRLLDEADVAGRLDTAIYALLLDAPLHAEFVAWRATHREELLAYIREVLAVWP